MIKVEVIENFNLKDFDKIKNLKRKAFDIKGKLFVGDIFECNESMVKYLTGANIYGKTVVRVVEFKPMIEKEIKEQYKEPTTFKVGQPQKRKGKK